MDRFWQAIEQELSQQLGCPIKIKSHHEVSGGCINQAYTVITNRGLWFVKINSADKLSMFAAEAQALTEITSTHTVAAPEPVSYGIIESRAYLILEHMDLNHPVSPAAFGSKMAQLHSLKHEHFGWVRNNTIGSTSQINTQSLDWRFFFSSHRLDYQTSLAQNNGAPHSLITSVKTLQQNLGHLFSDYQPFPSLLHGDLWSGNWGGDTNGEPIIFDPASYYGDHEADLAMMELFGHPGTAFYDAYAEILPIDAGYKTRRVLYNLYHILNHFNLFGGGYAAQAENMSKQLLSEIH